MEEPKQSSTPSTATRRTLKIKRGELQKTEADVIVSTIRDLDLSHGTLSRAILQSAGPKIQNECTQYEGSKDLVIITNGYRLPCEKVFHINLPAGENPNTIIPLCMDLCFTSANHHEASSIAFPALGTGILGYNPTHIAKNMLVETANYLTEKPTSLEEVMVIIHPTNDIVFEAFQEEFKKLPLYPGIDFWVEDKKASEGNHGMGTSDPSSPQDQTKLSVTIPKSDVNDGQKEVPGLQKFDHSKPQDQTKQSNGAEEESEKLEAKIVKVHGVPLEMNLEVVKGYFENRSRSGGGEVTGLKNNEDGTILIKFASSKDAIRVAQLAKHFCEGKKFTVNLHLGSNGNHFILSDVKTDLRERTIAKFLETQVNIRIKDMVKIESENFWIVRCHGNINFTQVQKLCEEHTMNLMSDTYPKVTPLQLSDSIYVSALHPRDSFTEEMIQQYFQRWTPGGQNVKFVQKLSAGQFLVTLPDPGVTLEVCEATHAIKGIKLQVMPYNKNLQNDEKSEDSRQDSASKMDSMKTPNKNEFSSMMDSMNASYENSSKKSQQDSIPKLDSSKPTYEDSPEYSPPDSVSKSFSAKPSYKDLTEREQSRIIKTDPESSEEHSASKLFSAKASYKDSAERDKSRAMKTDPENSSESSEEHSASKLFSTKTSLEDSTERNQSQAIEMISYKKDLLFAGTFPQEIQVKYPGTHIKSGMVAGMDQIIIEGKSSNITAVKHEIYEYLSNIKLIRVELPEYTSFILENPKVKNYIIQRLKSQNCSVTWEIKMDDFIRVYTMQDGKSQIIEDIFKSSIKTLDFRAEEPTKHKRKWDVFKQGIRGKYKDLVYFNEKTLVGVTVNYLEEEIKDEFVKSFHCNVIQEKLVPLGKARADYIKGEKINHIRDFCQEFGTEDPVNITITPDNQISIRASEEKMEKASEFIKGVMEEVRNEMISMSNRIGVETRSQKAKKSMVKIQVKYYNRLIEIHEGDITQLDVDAIVNTANEKLKPDGALATAIFAKGGKMMIHECEEALSNTGFIPVGSATLTSNCSLPCKYVIHAVGPVWKGGSNNERNQLSKTIKETFKIANERSVVSIAFPTFSAGIYGYPLELAVEIMMLTVKECLEKYRTTSLKTIIFVDTNQMVTKEFHGQAIKIFSPEFSPRRPDTYAAAANPTPRPQQRSPSTSLSQPRTIATRRTLTIMRGELQKSQADVIVNSIGSDMDLSQGAISKAILQSAGPEIQTECFKHRYLEELVITDGYRLPCKKVYHVKVPHGQAVNEVIPLCMNLCFTAADHNKVSTIAFPSLGTGGMRYPRADVAKSMLNVASNYLSGKSTSLGEIYIIIYPKDEKIFKEFEKQLEKLPDYPEVDIYIEGKKKTKGSSWRIW